MATRKKPSMAGTSFRDAPDGGGWVESVHRLDPGRLRGMLPPQLTRHASAPRFIENCIESAALWRHFAKDKREGTPSELRTVLQTVEQHTHAARASLRPLGDGSESFDTLQPSYEYLTMRAREGSATDPDRPPVPDLPTKDTPKLADLLSRLDRDLRTLEMLCEHVASKIEPSRNPEKFYERSLARALVLHHRDAFGTLPPVRQWFGDRFVTYIGDRVGMTIGWRLISEEITKLR